MELGDNERARVNVVERDDGVSRADDDSAIRRCGRAEIEKCMSTELRAGAEDEDVSVRVTVRALGLAELGRAS